MRVDVYVLALRIFANQPFLQWSGGWARADQLLSVQASQLGAVLLGGGAALPVPPPQGVLRLLPRLRPSGHYTPTHAAVNTVLPVSFAGHDWASLQIGFGGSSLTFSMESWVDLLTEV